MTTKIKGEESVGRNSQITLINDDCLVAMKSIPSGSIDAVICDPPYG